MSDCGCEFEARDRAERRTLWILLSINASLFVVELGVGWLAQSTGLIADSLDMLADAMVYGISLYAVGAAAARKRQAARWSGLGQIALALLVLFEVIRRTLTGSEPVSALMMGMAVVALAGNVTCLLLVRQHRDGGVHMRASWIFSSNDVIANLGVIVAGALVAWSGAAWPDLVIGGLIAAVVLYFLTVGQVKGSAPFLGLATVLDLVATYFVIGPAIRLMARRDAMSDRPRRYGLPSGEVAT